MGYDEGGLGGPWGEQAAGLALAATEKYFQELTW